MRVQIDKAVTVKVGRYSKRTYPPSVHEIDDPAIVAQILGDQAPTDEPAGATDEEPFAYPSRSDNLEEQVPLFDLPPIPEPEISPEEQLARERFEPDNSPIPDDIFAGLPLFGFDLIMIDPPWPFANYSAKGLGKAPAKHYRTWTIDKIKRLPVGQLAAGNCALFLWACSPLLFDASRPSYSPTGDVLQAWGFKYGALGGWAKKTVNEKTAWGPGYVVRSVMEPFIIATTGSPEHSKGAANLIDGIRREHSRKPETAYRWCEEYMPKARRIELFSRTERKGWSVWGDEVGKFEAEA